MFCVLFCLVLCCFGVLLVGPDSISPKNRTSQMHFLLATVTIKENIYLSEVFHDAKSSGINSFIPGCVPRSSWWMTVKRKGSKLLTSDPFKAL